MVVSQKVHVKDNKGGKTFQTVNLITTGTIILQMKTAILPGVEAYADVDGDNRKPWPVGSKSVEVRAEIGTRTIRVFTKKPLDKE